MSFPEGSSFFDVEIDILAREMSFPEGFSSLKVETHFQTSCPTSAKRQVHAFLVVLISDIHTEVFQPF